MASQTDPSTEAVIAVLGSARSFETSLDSEGTQFPAINADLLARIRKQDEQIRTELVNTVEFSYSSDIMQIGDPFSVVIPNPRGLYTNKFLRGQKIQLFLRNPNVQGGQQTLKQLGIITRRHQSTSSQGGSVIRLDCADLGWHLAHNDASLWYELQNIPFRQLLLDPAFIDPSWGINMTQIAGDTEFINSLKLGLGLDPQRRNEGLQLNNGLIDFQQSLQSPLGVLVHLQVEPGDKVADIIAEYARRENKLFGVGPDGRMVFWNPNYSREPLYRIELHDLGESGSGNPNNVLDASVDEDIEGMYTEVTCIGDNVAGILAPDPANQNATKRRGSFFNEYPLPFLHRMNFADGNIFTKDNARKQARWRYERSLYDSWQAVYVVRGHHQGNYWWESDQMCTVHDTLHGINGSMYVSSVRYDRDSQGDRTTVTIRKPGLLQAAFGPLPMPPSFKGSLTDTSGTATSSTYFQIVNKPQ